MASRWRRSNLNWGETTEEEMCLDVLYVTQ